jgi:hypothetical protein
MGAGLKELIPDFRMTVDITMITTSISVLLLMIALVGTACVQHHRVTMCCGRCCMYMITCCPTAFGSCFTDLVACCVTFNAWFTVIYERVHGGVRRMLRCCRPRRHLPQAYCDQEGYDSDMGACSVYTIFNENVNEEFEMY